MILLTDAMSPVTGLKEKEVDFLSYCKRMGATLTTTAKVFSLPCCADLVSTDNTSGKEGFRPLERKGSERTDLTTDSKGTDTTGSSFGFLNLSLFDSHKDRGSGVFNSSSTDGGSGGTDLGDGSSSSGDK